MIYTSTTHIYHTTQYTTIYNTQQEENFHWNFNFANDKFAKLKFHLLLYFKKSLDIC